MNGLDLQWYSELAVVPPFSHAKQCVEQKSVSSLHLKLYFWTDLCNLCNYYLNFLLPKCLSVMFSFIFVLVMNQTG